MTSESSGSRLPILFRSSRILAYAALLSAIISAAFLYRNAIGSLFLAWQRPEYSHGYFIPFLALLIGLKRHVSGFGEGSAVSWAGLGTMLVAIFFGIFGNLAGINDIAAYGLILCVAGLLIVTTGWKAAVRLWPAVIYLGFMLPLPNSIYWPLSIKLQFLSSKIGVAIIGLMGIPVYLEGNIIDLGTYQLQVAEACSGLRYLFPLMSFGFLVATLYRGPSWQKVLLFLATIPITIFMNSGRIGVIGYLVNSYGIAQAEGFLHLFEGWVVFALCILLLLAIAAALSRKFAVADFLDLEFDGFSKRFTLLTDVPFRNGIIVSAVLLALAAVVSPALFKQVSIHPQRTALDHFPMDISGWHGTRQFLSFDVERVLNADDYLLADFSDPVGSKVPVNLLISYYQSQTEGSGIHSPEVCIPAGGWEVSKWEQSHIDVPAFGAAGLVANRAIIQKERDRQLVYYWFQQRGRQLTSDYLAKAYTVYDSVTVGRSDGALIRVVTPIGPGDIPAAEERIRQFLAQSANQFPAFVPP